MITKDEEIQLQRIESALHVKVVGNDVLLEVRARGAGALFFVKMSDRLWREFCRRQLAVPPPLPKTKP